MSLLNEIQDAAASSDTRVADLLRKCQILAARLSSNELEQWVERELNGYPTDAELPDYRIAKHVPLQGDFASFGGMWQNVPIPTTGYPVQIRSLAEAFPLRSGVTVYEEMLEGSSGNTKGDMVASWPADMLGILVDKGGSTCVGARFVVPRGALVRLLDTVRNRILGFALDIEQKDPDAGDASPQSTPLPPSVVSQVFNQNFHGPVGNVATGSHDFAQTTTMTQACQSLNMDLGRLAEELARLRVLISEQATEPEHYEALAAIRGAEIAAQQNDEQKVLGLLRKIGPWGLNAATSIGTTLVAEAIKGAMGM